MREWTLVRPSGDGRRVLRISSRGARGPCGLGRFGLLHERLRWFTDDWLRYDVVGDALVVSDLRMGMAGHYTFRFKMAQRAPDGAWTAVTPSVWPSDRGGWNEFKLVLARILDAQPPLPLAQWAEQAAK